MNTQEQQEREDTRVSEATTDQKRAWEKVEDKGMEKLKKLEKALERKEGFAKAHKEYYEFIRKLAEVTGLTEEELDTHFIILWTEEQQKNSKSEARDNDNCK